MKRSVLVFLAQLGITFVLAITLSIFLGEAVRGSSGLEEKELVRGAMALGGLIASLNFAMYAGWKGLSLKASLGVVGIVTAVFSANVFTIIAV